MTAFTIGDEEWRQMRRVDHLARDLYSALRRRMDFGTGIVGGEPAAVSWYALREDTELEGRPGVRGGKPSEAQLRRRVMQLEKVGLVESIGTKLLLKFRLLLARKSSLAPEKAVGGTTGPAAAAKAKPAKRSRAYPQGNNVAKADTHQESGKTLKPTPPTPSCLRHEEDGKAINPPTPAAQEADNPLKDDETTTAINPPAPAAQEEGNTLKGDETPIAAQGRHGHSEQRHEPLEGGGDRPPARLAGEKGSEPVLTWEPHLDWPTGITQRQRAYIARSTAPLSKTLAQRVLDEWHGATMAGVVGKAWPYFNSLLRNAKECGEAWETRYAEDVEAAREQERIRLANQAAADAAFAAQIDGKPGPLQPGELGKLVRRGGRK